MKAYIKSYEEIKKNGIVIGDFVHANKTDIITFIPCMKFFCGKGPFEFIAYNDYGVENCFEGVNYVWHISWLMSFLKDKQYLLEF